MLRIYAAYGRSMTMNRTGRALASMTKAKVKKEA